MSDSVKMKNLRGLIACFVLSGVCGCGGDDSTLPTENASSISSSSDESVNTDEDIINEASVQAVRGRFIGSAVEGLEYASDDLVGFTDVEGRFEYRDEQAIEFSIGGITLGKALGTATMTPVTLVAGAVDEQHPVVTNIARFLQTLDDDGDPANGISITPGVTELALNKILDFDQSVLAFEDDGVVQTVVAELTAVTSAGARTLITVDEAQALLRETLLEMYAGVYTGTFDGAGAGSLELAVDDSGNVTGGGCIDSDSSGNGGSVTSASQCTSAQAMEISGALKSSGEFDNVIGESASHSVLLEGSIDWNGKIAGIWENVSLAITGTFTGHKDLESNGSSLPGDADTDTDQCIDIGTTSSSCSSSSTSVSG